MNSINLPTHALPPSLDGVDTVRPLSYTSEHRLGAISGNDLLDLNVWGNIRAGDRSLSVANAMSSSPNGPLDATVAHILEPLG